MKLKDVPYRYDFYWNGERYKQVLRPKFQRGKFNVVCRLLSDPYSKWVDMPSGRQVKPVVRNLTDKFI